MPQYKYIVSEDLNKERIDKILSSLCREYSRSFIQKAIIDCKVKVNGKIISDCNSKLHFGDVIKANFEEITSLEHIEPKEIKLDIVFEDDDLLIINKPHGLSVHPGAGNDSDTLVNGLLFHTKQLSDVGGEFRPGIVHRLDKDTSGLMMVAKNNFTHQKLSEMIEKKEIERKYKTIIWGMIKPLEGIIDKPIARSNADRTKMTIVRHGGKNAITYYKTLAIFKGGLFSLLECKLGTGRTHQIRVHLSQNGHSILGDQIYGNNNRKVKNISEDMSLELANLKRQALHSFYLKFIHPRSNEALEFEIDLPNDMMKVINLIKN